MKTDTKLTTLGRDPEANFGVVNPPVYHASTILFPTLAAIEAAQKSKSKNQMRYGRYGTPTTFALQDAIAELEGGYAAFAVGSGAAAILAVLMAFTKSGDHVLCVDTAYAPTRRYCDVVLKRYGVETTYYDPAIGAGIAALIKPNTTLCMLESPGSMTFEVQDVPAIVAACKAKGVATAMDNTWATALYFRPFDHGVDVSVQAGTKYVGGHSDIMLGLVAVRDQALYEKVRPAIDDLGAATGPDDQFLALRGLRTLGVRMPRHYETGLKLARWLERQPEVARVLHPALPSCPGHELWKRDFKGASGLFAFVLKPVPKPALAAMLDDLELYGMGFSWGGFESLIVPGNVASIRTAT
ncbi:MAG: cystathionine beta-lyase, partial [Tagaea sp.]|nr:cystathionine beta-lyase [Tagaea sp.]